MLVVRFLPVSHALLYCIKVLSKNNKTIWVQISVVIDCPFSFFSIFFYRNAQKKTTRVLLGLVKKKIDIIGSQIHLFVYSRKRNVELCNNLRNYNRIENK